MAAKFETEEQFLESIFRQVGNGIVRHSSDRAYNGGHYRPTVDTEDEDYVLPNNQANYWRNLATQDDSDPEPETIAPQYQPPQSNPLLRQRENPVVMKGIRKNSGSYSSDMGRHAERPAASFETGLDPKRSYMGDEESENPREDVKRIKKAIQEKEAELHDLQKQKVELMRKITGRL